MQWILLRRLIFYFVHHVFWHHCNRFITYLWGHSSKTPLPSIRALRSASRRNFVTLVEVTDPSNTRNAKSSFPKTQTTSIKCASIALLFFTSSLWRLVENRYWWFWMYSVLLFLPKSSKIFPRKYMDNGILTTLISFVKIPYAIKLVEVQLDLLYRIRHGQKKKKKKCSFPKTPKKNYIFFILLS